MNKEEQKKTRSILIDIIHARHLKPDTKVDEILSYINSLVRGYTIVERFDEIEFTRDENVRKCRGICSSGAISCMTPCYFIKDLFMFVFQFMQVTATILGTMYILYYFFIRTS